MLGPVAFADDLFTTSARKKGLQAKADVVIALTKLSDQINIDKWVMLNRGLYPDYNIARVLHKAYIRVALE